MDGAPGEVKKKMGGTLWEEPIFFFTSPGAELEFLGLSEKELALRRGQINCFIPARLQRVTHLVYFFMPLE